MSFINAIFTLVNPVMTSKLLCTNIEKNDNLKKNIWSLLFAFVLLRFDGKNNYSILCKFYGQCKQEGE